MIYDASEGEFFPVSAIADQNFGYAKFEIFYIDALMVSKDYDIDLHDYMNLISFYALPEDNSVSNVMVGLAGNGIMNIQAGLTVSD